MKRAEQIRSYQSRAEQNVASRFSAYKVELLPKGFQGKESVYNYRGAIPRYVVKGVEETRDRQMAEVR